jgi:hypothetical protein
MRKGTAKNAKDAKSAKKKQQILSLLGTLGVLGVLGGAFHSKTFVMHLSFATATHARLTFHFERK